MPPERSDDQPVGEYRREGPSPKMIGAGIVAVLLLVFILQNTERTTIKLLLWNFDTQVWVAIVIAAVAGFAIGWVAGRVGRRSDRD